MASANNRPRTITPTSPSPSPSPRQSAANLPRSAAAAAAAAPPARAAPPPAESQQAPRSHEELVRADLENKTRAIVDNLYQIAVIAAETQPGSENLVARKVNETVHALAQLDATKVNIKAMVPEDVVEMLDAGRNPDIHTRNFVTRLAAENQYSYGQHAAVKEYNLKLTAALDQAFPDLAADHAGAPPPANSS
ncbi:uncharacterized protein PFL1_06673 [Pseudozyma flocculosa PF-1]|uniref:Mediator of RNA polymerase II transcription subunit 10 n=2 Tax=Pseudozyma flocculosa TaxID=84751 RepID=A0A5C3F7T1_9BASI|nr:uncharacterized protein PFL1_06673 [Pseudozyma flocculosa PF-1]EPQ25806.1 hypothetical protein PFL1_06673 [Pseudozyma flocculosa PF-1]SPO40493.1 related to Mediator of RNA polymerase II transcription subunit 10 [Pseudozyma flocculosa]